MTQNRQQLQLSVFDRLDQGPAAGDVGERVADIERVRRAVLRDVENLLNTRRGIVKPSESFHFLNQSLYTYGIDDFVAQNPRSGHVQKVLEATIHDAICLFEPRLRNVEVALQPTDDFEPHLCFAVRATLHAEPVQEPITFDTWFSASRGEYKIDPHQKAT